MESLRDSKRACLCLGRRAAVSRGHAKCQGTSQASPPQNTALNEGDDRRQGRMGAFQQKLLRVMERVSYLEIDKEGVVEGCTEEDQGQRRKLLPEMQWLCWSHHQARRHCFHLCHGTKHLRFLDANDVSYLPQGKVFSSSGSIRDDHALYCHVMARKLAALSAF